MKDSQFNYTTRPNSNFPVQTEWAQYHSHPWIHELAVERGLNSEGEDGEPKVLMLAPPIDYELKDNRVIGADESGTIEEEETDGILQR